MAYKGRDCEATLWHRKAGIVRLPYGIGSARIVRLPYGIGSARIVRLPYGIGRPGL